MLKLKWLSSSFEIPFRDSSDYLVKHEQFVDCRMCKCEEQLDLLMKLLKVSDDRLLMEHVTEYEALSLNVC